MEALLVLALLACPVGMGVMMWWMNRGMKKQPEQQQPAAHVDNADDMRAEQARLTAEIDQLHSERASRAAKSGS